MQHVHTPILPKPTDPQEDSMSHSTTPLPRKRNVRVACDPCRAKKSACDGKQPVCGPCSKRVSKCIYRATSSDETSSMALRRQVETLKQELREQDKLLNHLKSIPEKEGIELLRHLRSSSDLSRYQPSQQRAARGTLPPMQADVEFELTVRHPMAYPALIPVNTAHIDLSPSSTPGIGHSRIPGNGQSFGGIAAKGTYGTSPKEQLESISTERVSSRPVIEQSPSVPSGVEAKNTNSMSDQSHVHSYLDDRLRLLHIGYWSKVPISNELAAKIISFYLEVDHPTFGFFDADLFVADLVDCRLRFSSSFLVSSLLFNACQSYTAVDVEASTLSHAFFVEAKMQWRAERSSDSIITAAALQIFGYGCATRGMDEFGLEVCRESRKMAERLGLLGAHDEKSINASYASMSPEWKKAAAHVAWGIHNILTLRAFFYQDEPVTPPPICPIPGREGTVPCRVSGILWPPHPLPHYVGVTFTALCEFWKIAWEIASVYFDRGGAPLKDRVPLAFAESMYQKLLDWADKLAPGMARKSNDTAHVILFHVCFHSTVVDIFRPFLQDPHPHRLRSFFSKDSTPDAIFTASLNQLKRLSLVCILDCPRTLCSTLPAAASMHLFGAVLNNKDDPDWRFYFMLSMHIIGRLYVCFAIYKQVMQGFLAMAIKNDALTSSEASNLIEQFEKRGKHHEAFEQAVAFFTLDFDLAMTNPDNAKAHALALQFDELSVFDKFTRGDYVNPEFEATTEVEGKNPIAR